MLRAKLKIVRNLALVITGIAVFVISVFEPKFKKYREIERIKKTRYYNV